MINQQNIGAVMTEMTARCTSCGDCLRPCAFLQQQGTPAQIAQRGASPANLLTAYGCSLCGLCDAVCPEGLSPSAMFLAMRREAALRDMVDLKPYRPWLTYEQLGSSFLFRRAIIPTGCRTVFFPGCSLPGTRPEAVKELFARLQQQDQSIGLILDCCGKISHDLGLQNQFDGIFSRLLKRLEGYGITRVLTACPGCSKVLQTGAQGLEIHSVYELLADNQTETTTTLRGIVSIHDPCPARFDHQQQLAVRALVESCGYQIEELASSGMTTRCCGQGGMVEGCLPGTIEHESRHIAAEAAGRPVISYCASCSDTLAAITPSIHVAELLLSNRAFSNKPVTPARRWLNRLKLRFARF